MSSALWLVAWWPSRLAMLVDPRIFVHGARGVIHPDSSSPVSALGVGLLGPNTSLLSFTRFRSPYYRLW